MIKDSLHDVYLALGTNLGDRETNMRQALQYIEKRIGTLIACSAFLVTEPFGFDSSNQFFNAACHVQTSLDPLTLLEVTQSIEGEMGRQQKSVAGIYADRIIDIDILLYDSLIMDDEHLTLPHPHLHERDFVMIPLAQIADTYHHPILHKSVGQLRSEL